jgi:glycosyltransferase involved in cell wall biosynthesis
MSLKVLILSTSLGLGGGDREVVQISSHLRRQGYDVKILVMVQIGVMGQELIEQGFDVQSLNMNRGVPDIRVIPRLTRIIREWQPDILHSHMVHANLLARLTRIFIPNLPVLICTAQNVDESEGQKWRDVAYRLTDALCDLTTNVTKAGVDRYIDIGLASKHKIQFIPNSVDHITYSPDLSLRDVTRSSLNLGNRFVWLAVGRFYLQKDYPTMIRAFSQVVLQRPDSLLIIAGEGGLGGLESEIKDMVKEYKLEASIKFLGPRRDISALMNAADAQVMSSAWEGMPLVLLEAASCELPIVATDVGGVAETLIDEESGYLVPPANPDLLALFMLKLMDLPDSVRSEMGKIGRHHVVSNYATTAISEQWMNLYHKLLAQKSPNRLKLSKKTKIMAGE